MSYLIPIALIVITAIICFTLNKGVNICITHVQEVKYEKQKQEDEFIETAAVKEADLPPSIDDVMQSIQEIFLEEDSAHE